MKNLVGKSIKMRLASPASRGGNAYFLMAAFTSRASMEDWTSDEIRTVLAEAITGSYDHLREVLEVHCIPSSDALDSSFYNPPDDTQNGHP